MSGLISFGFSVLLMLLIAIAILRRSRQIMNLALTVMVMSSLYAWHAYIFSEGLQPVFFIGSFAMVVAISCFFYAVYSFEYFSSEQTDTELLR